MKKGIRHPSTKTKPSNILTPTPYEQAELSKLSHEIKDLENKYREIKRREQADELKLKDDGGAPSKFTAQQNKDFLLMDQSGIDYEQMKN